MREATGSSEINVGFVMTAVADTGVDEDDMVDLFDQLESSSIINKVMSEELS